MHRLQVMLTEDQMAALREYAAKDGKPVADLIRESVDSLISKRKVDRAELVRRALSVVGKYRSGHSDISRNHDEYLADDIYERKVKARAKHAADVR